MSTIKRSQEQKVNDVAVTKKKIESAEVCEELTSSNNKDDDTAVTTQVCFAEVTDTLNEVTCFSQLQASLQG